MWENKSVLLLLTLPYTIQILASSPEQNIRSREIKYPPYACYLALERDLPELAAVTKAKHCGFLFGVVQFCCLNDLLRNSRETQLLRSIIATGRLGKGERPLSFNQLRGSQTLASLLFIFIKKLSEF